MEKEERKKEKWKKDKGRSNNGKRRKWGGIMEKEEKEKE